MTRWALCRAVRLCTTAFGTTVRFCRRQVERVEHGRVLDVPNGLSAAREGADGTAGHGEQPRSLRGRAKRHSLGAVIELGSPAELAVHNRVFCRRNLVRTAGRNASSVALGGRRDRCPGFLLITLATGRFCAGGGFHRATLGTSRSPDASRRQYAGKRSRPPGSARGEIAMVSGVHERRGAGAQADSRRQSG
jgi:hypothetical protein